MIFAQSLRVAIISFLILGSTPLLVAEAPCGIPYDAYIGYSPTSQDLESRYTSCNFQSSQMALTYSDKFMWRGLNLTNGSVLQPGASVTQGNFSAILWGNLDLSDINRNAGNFTRVDIVFDYRDRLKLCNLPLEYSCGMIHYVYPSTEDDNSTEIYAALTLDWLISSTLSFFYDIDEVNGWYLNFSLEKDWGTIYNLSRCMSVGLVTTTAIGSGNCNYCEFYYGLEKTSLLDFYATISLPITYNKWCCAPCISYSYLLDSKIRASNIYESSNIWGGITVARSF